MNWLRSLVLALCVVSFASLAETPKSYQVTGEVTALTDEVVTVIKGKEKFELARTADVKVEGGDLKVGAKVTVEYRMTATSITLKPAKGAKPEKK